MNFLQLLDSRVTVFFYDFIPHNSYFTPFFSFFSLYGNSFIIWAVIGAIVIALEERRHPGIQKKDILFVLTFIVSFFTTSGLVLFLKELFQRPRPFVPHLVKAISCNFDYAMPSGHAAAAFAAATVFSSFDKKRRWLYYFIAILVSFSRIYLGCHYFLDVVIGATLGLFVSKIIVFFTTKIENGK